jgi:hypothetical protein
LDQPSNGSTDKGQSGGWPLGFYLSPVHQGVQSCGQGAWNEDGAISDATQRTKHRSQSSVEKPGRSAEARRLESLQERYALRETRSSSLGVQQARGQHSGIPPGMRDTARGCGSRNKASTKGAGAYRLKGKYVADLFAGHGGVSRAVRAAGFNAKEWELLHGEHGDLTRPMVRHRIKQDVRNGLVLAAMLAPPCSSFSPARDRTSVIRTKECPWGIPSHLLNAKDQIKVQIGNDCVQAAIELAVYFHKHKLPWILENPHASKMWFLAPLIDLMNDPDVQIVVSDFCQFGTKWRKRTRFLCGNIDYNDLHRVRHMCLGKEVCNVTGKPHFHLTGSQHGIPWTRIAQPYPPRLCHGLVHALTAHVVY